MTKVIFVRKLLISLVLLQCFVKAQCEGDLIIDCPNISDSSRNGVYFCPNYASLRNFTNPEKIEVLTMLQIDNSGVLKAGMLFSANVVNLYELILERNCRIKKIEVGAFKGGHRLKYLTLQRNFIEDLDLKVFADLPNLITLRLGGNPLKRFSDDAEFPRMNLSFLELRSCEIKFLPLNLFKNLENLTVLHFEYNQLRTLDWKVFNRLKHFRQVHLHRNPFHCDCHVQFLLDFFDKKNITWSRPTPDCFSSEEGADIDGVSWNNLDRNFLTCAPEVRSLNISNSNTIKDSVLLECEYSGYPVPNVTWTLNGKVFTLEDSATIQNTALDDVEEFPELDYKFRQTLSILLSSIPNSARNDIYGSNFTCTVQSNAGNSNQSISFDVNNTVLFPPIKNLNNASSNPLGKNVDKQDLNSYSAIIITIVVVTFATGAAFIAFRYFRNIIETFTKRSSGADQGVRRHCGVSGDETTPVTKLIEHEL